MDKPRHQEIKTEPFQIRINVNSIDFIEYDCFSDEEHTLKDVFRYLVSQGASEEEIKIWVKEVFKNER